MNAPIGSPTVKDPSSFSVRWCAAALVAATSTILPAQLAAQEDEYPLFDHFSLAVGGRLSSLDTTVRIDSQRFGVGTEIDVEDVLGLEDDPLTFDAQFEWQIGRRHNLTAAWSRYERDGDRRIVEELEVGDTIFPINVQIRTNFDIETLTAGYRYYFYRAPAAAFGVGGGLRQYSFDLGLSVEDRELAESADVSGPLPYLGFDYRYAFSDSWRLLAEIGVFEIELGDYEGGQLLASAIGEYLPFAHFSFGGGFDLGQLDVDADGENWRGKIESDIFSLRAFARGRW